MENVIQNGRQVDRKARKILTTDVVIILVNMIREKKSPKEIASSLSIKTVYKWKTKYEDCEENGQELIKNIKKVGRKKYEKEELQNKICEIIQADCTLTQKGIKGKFQETGVFASQSKISKVLVKAEITRKRLRKKSVKITSPEVIMQRKVYAREMHSVRNSRILFLDETGFNLHTKNNYGYSPKNVNAVCMVPANRGRNVSVLSLLSSTGILKTKIIDGSYNGIFFLEFLEECVSLFDDIEAPILVMDNVKFHHIKEVGLFAERNSIRLQYLPPYSPDLNPIENVFLVLKSRYHNVSPYPTTNTGLKSAILQKVDEMNQTLNFGAFYEKMRGFLDLAFSGEFF